MEEVSISCPHCGENIILSEALVGSLLTDFKVEIEEQVKENIKDTTSLELADLKEQVGEKEKELQEARERELEHLRLQRKLQEKEKNLEIEIETRLIAERSNIEDQVSERITQQHRLKEIENDKQLEDLKKQIEDLKRKADIGSQQAQGESAEIELESLLSTTFHFDQIEPVGKGIKGADVIQKVHTPSGRYCGTIIWESKNTKNWSDGWIAKLKDDQRAIKAELSAIATVALPKDITHFGQKEGVWVTDFPCAIGIATALRENLIQLSSVKMAAVGKNEKMEVIYNYLSGPEFKLRIEAVVDAFMAMNDDLAAERRSMERIWSKREKEIQRVFTSVAGMYGDVQGIIGSALPKIERLELTAIAESAQETSKLLETPG